MCKTAAKKQFIRFFWLLVLPRLVPEKVGLGREEGEEQQRGESRTSAQPRVEKPVFAYEQPVNPSN